MKIVRFHFDKNLIEIWNLEGVVKICFFLPGDGVGTAMSWKNRRMVDDALVFGGLDDLHRNELGAEGQNVERRIDGPILFEHGGNDDTLLPPRFKFEHGNAVLSGLRG